MARYRPSLSPITTSAALRVAPTSSTARKTNCSSFAPSTAAGSSMTAITASSVGCRDARPERMRVASGAPPSRARIARMLLGRDDERLALDRLLAQARQGRSRVLALVGEPGIGKTSLLDHAAASAEGMRVLRARGIQSEAEVPFAGLAELLRPALPALDQIPRPQARALAGALALEPAT